MESVAILDGMEIRGSWDTPQGRLLNFQGIPHRFSSEIDFPISGKPPSHPPEGTYHDIHIEAEEHGFSTSPGYWLRIETTIITPGGSFPISEEIYAKAIADASEIPVALEDAIRRANLGVILDVTDLKKVWVWESDEYTKAYDRFGKQLLSQDGFHYYDGQIDKQKWEAWANEYKAAVIPDRPHWYSPRTFEVLRKIELEMIEDLAKSHGRWREDETKKFLHYDEFNTAIMELTNTRIARGMDPKEIRAEITELLDQLDPLQREDMESRIRSWAGGGGKLSGFVKGGLTRRFSEDVRETLRVAAELLDEREKTSK